MNQDHSYPDPAQLREYAEEPMPFHQILPSDLEIMDDGTIRYGVGNVEYHYVPEYINVETEEGEWHRVSDLSWFDMSHSEAWEWASDWTIEDDFILTTGMTPGGPDTPPIFDAYWILSEIVISNE